LDSRTTQTLAKAEPFLSMPQKAKSKKQDKRATRQMYTWHLNDSKFDRTQWWQNIPDGKIEPVAAVYELVRRHPIILAGRMGILDLRKRHWLDPIKYLSVYGLKSWPNLNQKLQFCWRKVAGNLKGVDCRDASSQCASIEADVATQIKVERAFTQKRYRQITIEKVSALIEKDIIKNPPSAKEMEAGIQRHALAAYRNGYLLLAVAPDLVAEKAKSLMTQEYREHQVQHRIHKQRARYKDWLPLISSFENSTLRHEKDSSQVFIRYRRAIDGICLI
jgi:hypothetical protein